MMEDAMRYRPARIVRTLVAVSVLWALIEGTASLGLYFLRVVGDLFYWPINAHALTANDIAAIKRLRESRQGYYALSPELGWTIGAHGSDENGTYRSNGSGIPGRPRV